MVVVSVIATADHGYGGTVATSVATGTVNNAAALGNNTTEQSSEQGPNRRTYRTATPYCIRKRTTAEWSVPSKSHCATATSAQSAES